MGVLWLISGGKPVETASKLAKRGYDRLPDGATDWIEDNASTMKRRVGVLGDQLSDVGDSAGAMVETATSKARETGAAAIHRASQLTSEATHTATDFARGLPSRSADLFDSARGRLNQMLDEQPLLLGAVGLAIGAGIAASLPSTRIEAEYFGETADDLKAQAASFVGQQSERIQTMADQALDAASDEARRQGLSPENVKAAASEFGNRVSHAASSVGDKLK
jgi:gas vesicle protein